MAGLHLNLPFAFLEGVQGRARDLFMKVKKVLTGGGLSRRRRSSGVKSLDQTHLLLAPLLPQG
ncbi:hypothetical protein AMTR_s00117p00113200 [Amborella trichopoda]|uniref:Uncharacterized protein n=1 Tax=Amborella trichopoda TaxID=13333 RepID=W1NQD7_AMBTC|nr:hypothetical protein AMTR_s00117p00113200 [Amborella trichopoda]